MNKRAYSLVFDCLQGAVCSPSKNYFERLNHNANTRNNGKSVKRLKIKLDFARRSFYFLGACKSTTLLVSLIAVL